MISILLMSDDVKIALISGGSGILASLIGAIGAFHVTAKKDRQLQQADREKQHEDLKAELIKYHIKNREEIKEIREKDLKEIRSDVSDIRDDVTNMGANLQSKLSLLELSQSHTREDIVSLKTEVEKHNGVIEKTYRLEDNDKLLEERIKVCNHRIADLEKRA